MNAEVERNSQSAGEWWCQQERVEMSTSVSDVKQRFGPQTCGWLNRLQQWRWPQPDTSVDVMFRALLCFESLTLNLVPFHHIALPFRVPRVLGEPKRDEGQVMQTLWMLFARHLNRDFPGGPVVKTSPSNADGPGSIPGQRAKIPHASWPKKPRHRAEAML